MALFFSRSRIAVVELFGTIGGAIKSPPYGRVFAGLQRDRRTRAVVLDIDSPGGSVAVSDSLYGSIRKVAAEKPVVAFIRRLGASGGYMVGCGANKIVAQPASLIGSIGVISVRPILEELLHRLGVDINVNKSGRLKDMGAFWRSPTTEEGEKFQAIVDHFYEFFVSRVAEARKLDEDTVRSLATGEVYTTPQALELGLIDEVGDLDRAIDLGAEMGKVARRPVYVKPRRSLRQRILGGFAQSLVEAVSEEVELKLSVRQMYL